jgi:hypothetical protein
MALLTNINGKFSVDTDGAASFNRIGASTTTGFTFPSADGANGEVLKTNGLGTVSWLPDSNTGTVTGTGSATRVAFWSSDSAITSDADLYWDNTNKRLGIGVSSPAALLEINGTGDAIRVESTNTGAGGAQMDLLHYSTSPADNDTMAYINMGGYYNTTPSQAYFSSIRTVATDISARQGELTFWTVNTTLQQRMVIDTDGNVGIGTNTPFGKVDIQYDMDVDTGSIRGLTAGVSQYGNINFSGVLAQGAGAASTSMQGITWQVNNYLGSTNYGNQAQIVVGNNGSIGTFMGFFTSGNYGAAPVEAIRIDSAQNVGIGTDLPSSKLHLRDPGTNSDVGIKIGNDSRDWNLKVMGSVSDSLQFFTHDNSNVMTILPSGNVGINDTNPGTKLSVNGANYVEMATFSAATGSTAGIISANSGFVTGFSNSSTHVNSNTAVFSPVANGIEILKAGLIQVSTNQDFVSTSSTGYAQVDIYKNGTVMFYSLRTNSNSQWDMLQSTGTMIVAANDVIGFRYAGGNFTSMDTGAWSQYSFVWTSR